LICCREEHALRVLENRALRRILTLKGEVREGWRRRHKQELHDWYSSSKITKVNSNSMRWERHVARMEEEKCLQDFCGET
jgi:hypothetical protein